MKWITHVALNKLRQGNKLNNHKADFCMMLYVEHKSSALIGFSQCHYVRYIFESLSQTV